MKVKLKIISLFIALPAWFAALPVNSLFAQTVPKVKLTNADLVKLRTAVEANPENLKAHEAYIHGVGIENSALPAQYEKWLKRFPKSAIVPYAIGAAYTDEESPKAKPYLLKAVKANPKLAKAWSDLWIDAERWGQFDLGQQYLKNAALAEPENPDYAFYYSISFDKTDREKYIQLTNELVKRFPSSERGAQGLYWLGQRSSDISDKLKWFAVLKEKYAPEKFSWSANGMTSYVDLLLKQDPKKAASIAGEMAVRKVEGQEWDKLEKAALTISEVKNLIVNKQGQEALNLLKTIKLPRYFRSNAAILSMKAVAAETAYGPRAALDSLLISFLKAPSVELKEQIDIYAVKSGLKTSEIEKEISNRLEVNAVQATPFTLKKYLTAGSASLADYKGKVVLLTYWFPGCGPCRGEFPHFENVVRKFHKEAVEYIGINIVPEQDDYVVPFMKSSKYSFTPLADVKDRVKGNLDNRGGAPTNFLIDQNGKIIFSNFRTDGDNEGDLELMINLILNKNKV